MAGANGVPCLQLVLALALAAPAAAEAPELTLPLRCTLQEDCFIQNYVDVDPSPAARDYRCGRSTYDGHKGVDFRIVPLAGQTQAVAVLAAAAGRVSAARDGMIDRLIGKDASSVAGRECGNGVVIDHGRGWQTQYCHLRSGSIRVRRGRQVNAGEPIGLVGYSGKTQFQHLHLALRHKGRVIDPFTGLGGEAGCNAAAKSTHWHKDIARQLTYRHGELIDAGFTDRPPAGRDLEVARASIRPPDAHSSALIFYARLINLEKGDRLRLVLNGPSGIVAQTTTKPLDRRKAQYLAYVGKKLRASRWPGGRYSGKVQLLRSGKVMEDRNLNLHIP